MPDRAVRAPVPDIPERAGGWWHEYVCPVHGTELLPASGDVYPCPHGCELDGEPYAGAWAVLAHQAAARELRRLAVFARADPSSRLPRPGPPAVGGPETGAPAADPPGAGRPVDAVVAGLVRYAALYRELAGRPHPDSRGWMLSGRMFQQALTEAIWATSLAHAVQSVARVVRPDRLPGVPELLRELRAAAAAAREVLVAREDLRNNYTAWLIAAGAATTRALRLLGDPTGHPGHPDATGWLDGPTGLTAHLAAAVHPDGWEWEASTYYHVFVLRAYLLALRGEQVAPQLAARLRDMVAVVAALGTDRGGTLPALHDTPYAQDRWDDEVYELCLLAARLPGTADLSWLAAPLATRLDPAGEGWWRAEESFEWFGSVTPLAPEPPDRGSRLFPDAGYAVLAGDGFRAVLDHGPHGGSHGHRDKLALYLYGPTAPWQPAYGVPPYASPLRHGYYALTAAHPTLRVDGAEQAEATGRLLYWRPTAGAVEVGAEADVYPGVRFARHVHTRADLLVDVVVATGAGPAGEREFVLHLRTDVEVTVRRTGTTTTTRWPGDQGLTGRHRALPATAVLTSGADLGPADDPQRTRPHLRWGVRAGTAVFVSAYTVGSAGREISELRVERTEAGWTVRVDRPGAEPVRWTVPGGDPA